MQKGRKIIYFEALLGFFFFFEEISFNESLKLASSGEMTQQKRYSKDISSGKASKLGSGEKNIKKKKRKRNLRYFHSLSLSTGDNDVFFS